MIPRRDSEGWREAGLFMWKVEREDNHGDRSTTTRFTLTFIAHWTLTMKLTRDWKEWDE